MYTRLGRTPMLFTKPHAQKDAVHKPAYSEMCWSEIAHPENKLRLPTVLKTNGRADGNHKQRKDFPEPTIPVMRATTIKFTKSIALAFKYIAGVRVAAQPTPKVPQSHANRQALW